MGQLRADARPDDRGRREDDRKDERGEPGRVRIQCRRVVFIQRGQLEHRPDPRAEHHHE